MVGVVQRHKIRAVLLVLGFIAGRNETGGIRTQDLIERGNVVVPVSGDQRVDSLLGALKCFLSCILRRRTHGNKQGSNRQKENSGR